MCVCGRTKCAILILLFFVMKGEGGVEISEILLANIIIM